MTDFVSRYQKFIFESYDFDHDSKVLTLNYSFDGERHFTEKYEFQAGINDYNYEVIERLSFYVWIVCGTSYYKTFVAPEIIIKQGGLTEAQADFFNMLYAGGLSQFLYENELHSSDLARFEATHEVSNALIDHSGSPEGVLLMESGGKDSILSAELLKEANHNFDIWYMGSTGNFPQEVFDTIGKPVHVSRRTIDLDAIKSALADGGLNGHVPFSAIYAGCALIQAVLVGKNQVFASNEASADEANITVDGFEVNHQFSKTYKVELALQDYIHTNIAPDLQYGSIMRPLSELKIAELFAKHAWNKYYKIFSSCNLANYKQGEDGGKLRWDGTCPKCVNAFLIFAPFVDRHELLEMFEGKNLSKDPELLEIYRQLLGLSDIKPFECVGTFDEMQLAYAMSVKNSDEYQVQGIGVVSEDFDYRHLGPYQPLFNEFLDYSNL